MAAIPQDIVKKGQTTQTRNNGSPPNTPRHAFVPHHFHSPTWCGVCNKFIWGLGKQGLKCKGCDLAIHKRNCPEGVPKTCPADKLTNSQTNRRASEIYEGPPPAKSSSSSEKVRALASSSNNVTIMPSSTPPQGPSSSTPSRRKVLPEQNTHVFAPYHFSKPTWCALCGKFIWGVSGKQGYRCTLCKTAIHKTGRCMDILLSNHKKSTCKRSFDLEEEDVEDEPKPVVTQLLESEVIMLHIFSYLDKQDMANVALVSQYFLSLVHEIKQKSFEPAQTPTSLNSTFSTSGVTPKRLLLPPTSMASKRATRAFQRMLVVTVIEAKDLEAKDASDSSLSDPFVVLRMDKHQRRKTKIKQNTMFPNWGETFHFLLAGESNLRIHVWDWNLVAKKRSLGAVSIPLAEFHQRDLVMKETWFKLEPKKAYSGSTVNGSGPRSNRSKGEIKLTIESKPLAVSETPLLDRATFLSESEEEEEAIRQQFQQRRLKILEAPINSGFDSPANAYCTSHLQKYLGDGSDPAVPVEADANRYRNVNTVPNIVPRRMMLQSALTFTKNAKTIELVASANIGDDSSPSPSPTQVRPPGHNSLNSSLQSAGSKQPPASGKDSTSCSPTSSGAPAYTIAPYLTYDDEAQTVTAKAFHRIYADGYGGDDDDPEPKASPTPPAPTSTATGNLYTNPGVYSAPGLYSAPGAYSTPGVYSSASPGGVYSTPGVYSSASPGLYSAPGVYSVPASSDSPASSPGGYDEPPAPKSARESSGSKEENFQSGPFSYGDHVSVWTEDKELTSNLGDWNFRYQRVMLMLRKLSEHNASGMEDVEVRRSLLQLSQDFLYTAKAYGKIIISEVYLPVSQKTIKPVDVGGIAGGEKYIIHNILFKFAVDSKGVYGGNDAAAAKAAGHDLKGLQSYVNCDIPGICTPFMVLVDYRGFRLIAMSILPIDKTTLIYGSANAGKTVANEDMRADQMMKLASKILNLKPHVIENKVMYSAVDLEGHRGKDGCFYLVDFSRVMPPEAPRRDIRNAKLFRLLRPEFVHKFHKPLCSDAFSPATRNDKSHNEEVVQATEFLFKDTIPKFAKELAVLWSQEDKRLNFRIAELLHSRGVNIRYLGLILASIESDSTIHNPTLSVIFVIEMVARVIKNNIRTKLREKMKELRIPVEEPYRRLVIEYLNLVFGDTMQSELYWNNSIRSDIKRTFTGFQLKAEEDEFNFSLKQLVNNYRTEIPGGDGSELAGKYILFTRIRKLSGLKFSTLFEKELAETPDKLDGERPFDEMDLEEVGERIKHTNTVQHAEGYMLVIKGILHRASNPAAARRYFHLAIEKFQEALDSNSNSKVILRDCAQAMIYLYREIENDIKTNPRDPLMTSSSNAIPTTDQHRHLLEQANNYYLRAIDIDPSDPKSLHKYARFLDSFHDNLDTAEDYYLQALEHNPDYTDGLFAYGAFLEAKRNEPEIAEKLYMRAKAVFVLEDQRQNAAKKMKRSSNTDKAKKNYTFKMYRKENAGGSSGR